MFIHRTFNMASARRESVRNLLCLQTTVIIIFSRICVSYEDEHKWIGPNFDDAGKIKLRNLDATTDHRTFEFDDGYVTDNRQDPVSPEMLGGIIIQHESQKLSARLRWLSNDEIGITNMQFRSKYLTPTVLEILKTWQAIFDSLPYVKKENDEKGRLDEIAGRLELRFRNYLQVLKTNKITVENLHKFHVKQPITQQYDCCSIPCKDFKLENLYGCKISRQTSCDLIPPSIPRGSFNPGRNLTDVWRSNVQYFRSLKWQYFISVLGLHNEYPASGYRWLGDCHSSTAPRHRHICPNIHDSRHRNVFLSTIQPQRKNVVIMMDHGNSMSVTQLRTAKAIARHLIASFSDNDRIGVIGLSSKPMYPRSDPCLPHTLVPATFETRIYFSKFIESLEKQESTTNHSLGFMTAFGMIEDALMDGQMLSDNALILYVSRGLLSSLTDAREVMDVVSLHNARTGHKVIINTYAVIDDGKPIMYEKSFMQDIAYQNFAKYDVKYRLKIPVVRGIMMAINSTQDLSSSVGRFYLPLNRTAHEDAVFSLPYIDEADGALTLSLSQPCFHSTPGYPEKTQLIGMVGVDLHMEDITQDITYYNNNDQSYAFLINTEGYTIMHPTFQRPLRTSMQPMHTDIRHFEPHSGFEEVRQGILSREEGHMSLLLAVTNYTDPDGQVVFAEQVAKYFWKKVDTVPYILVIKSYTAQEQRTLKGIHMHSQPELVYHRIDLLPQEKMCLHLKQLATLEISTVFLSPSSFLNPFEHLSEEETKRSIQSYLAYLKDDTRLITNPGLKESVRNDVGASSRINVEWIRRHHTSNLKDYIIRRYIGMPSGVLRMFPGTLLDKSFEPTMRAWYTNALLFPGHVTLSAPYLDVGGAGYVITISHTIFEGKPAALHSPSDKVVAVMGMDITLGYFHKLLAELVPPCEETSVRCFLMDDMGYLVVHPGLIDPTGKGPSEQRHITHMEPLVANDILNHRTFVRKRLCNRYNDRTVQRYFDFNTSFTGVLTNLAHGEHCARYQITHITGTNVFLGIVNHTCETATAFCPCSMYDRLCLNCKRMEQAECECPCECPLDMDFCSGELIETEDLNPSCPQDPEREQLMVPAPELTAELDQCFEPKCETRKSKLDCLGVVDCQWCQVQKDGQTPLKTPYCSSQRACFGGVVSAHSPYGDEISAEVNEMEPVTMKSTPVGPVAGGIMGCFLLLALGVYCYRHHVHRHSHQYVSTLPDNPHRGSHYYNDDEQEPTDDTSAGHTNFVLASFENPASISPYRVNTSYRRPAGGDSDHGYSTMTPHEDSEHASLPCLDPLSITKDRFKPTPYTLSVAHPPVLPPPPSCSSRRSRSPTPPHTRLSAYTPIPEQICLPTDMCVSVPGVTHLKGPHNIIANVQVHMVDSR